jgi:hypothetical protein
MFAVFAMFGQLWLVGLGVSFAVLRPRYSLGSMTLIFSLAVKIPIDGRFRYMLWPYSYFEG